MWLVIGGCTRLNATQMVGLTNIKHGLLPTAFLGNRGLIIWRRLAWWLNLQWFTLCSLLLSHMIGIFTSWMFIMLSWMAFFKKRYTWHNHLGLLILLFHLMCVVFINFCMAWNQYLELGTTGWASFSFPLDFKNPRLTLPCLFSLLMVSWFIYLCMWMIFY